MTKVLLISNWDQLLTPSSGEWELQLPALKGLHSELKIDLTKPHTTLFIKGLYPNLNSTQKLTIIVQLKAPECSCNLHISSSILKQGNLNLNAQVIIEPQATHSQARANLFCLLLHPKAQAFTSPSIKASNPSSQTSHSSIIKHLQPSDLWYWQSRGLSPRQAKQLLAGCIFT